MANASAAIRVESGAARGEGRAAGKNGVRETLREKIYHELRRALMHGRYDPGHRLTIHELAYNLRATPKPVREAVDRLVSERGLELIGPLSVRVPELSLVQMGDLFRARAFVECAALELASRRLTADDFEALRAADQECVDAYVNHPERAAEIAFEANRKFHFRIFDASGSAALVSTIESLWVRSGPLMKAAMRAYDPQSDLPACHFHDQIVDALTRCDVPAAQQAMTRDIGRVFRLLDIEIGAAPAEWGEAGQAAAS